MRKYVDEDYANELFQKVYPLGSIYLSTSAIEPSELFGFGVWERIKDAFLLTCGDTYLENTTGGSASHTLTVEEMPSHTHKVSDQTVDSEENSEYTFIAMRDPLSKSTGRRLVAAGEDYYTYTADPTAKDFVASTDMYYSRQTASTGTGRVLILYRHILQFMLGRELNKEEFYEILCF